MIGSPEKPFRAQRSLSVNLLESRPDAEDEAIKDLKREMRKAAGFDDGVSSPRSRANSDPTMNTPLEDMPCPEIGRLSDVAQPGGFRRHHMQQKEGRQFSPKQKPLVRLLLPQIRFWGDDEDEDELPAAPPTPRADASNLAVAFVIAKNFFGSAFMITPKGFQEAGIVGGPVCLLFVYVMEVRCMLNLIKCRKVLGPGHRYEDLGGALSPWFRSSITYMIILCQFGFCCIWLVSNADNLVMVFPQWSYGFRLWIQFPILFPLVWIRKLSLLAYTNVLGIGFTAVMVVYFFFFMGNKLEENGPEQVQMVNTKDTRGLLWLGACAYAYEGINIVLPTYESAKDKEALPTLLVSITSFNTMVYIVFGILTYYTLGDQVANLATLNLPRDSFEGKAIPMVSVLIGLVTFPLQAFVIFQTYEPKLSWSSSYRPRKWQKNAGRSLVLLFTVVITWLGGNELQNFLALVGGVCCASLALIFPSRLHMRICKPKGVYFLLDCFILVSGLAILVLSTTQAFAHWHN